MPRWHFRNRNHPGKGMCRMGVVSGVPGHKSGFDLSLSFSRWASDSAYSLCSRWHAHDGRWRDIPGTALGVCCSSQSCHTPWDPQLDAWPSSTAAGEVSGLAGPCLLLPYSSELCPSPLLACCASASRLCWVFNYHNIECRCYAKQPVWLSMLNSVETQLNKSTTIIPGGWLEPQDTSVISCGFYGGRCRFQPLESSYPTDNN